MITLLLYLFDINQNKIETSSAQGRREFTLLDDDDFNDHENLKNLLIFLHLRTMAILATSFSSESLSEYNII